MYRRRQRCLSNEASDRFNAENNGTPTLWLLQPIYIPARHRCYSKLMMQADSTTLLHAFIISMVSLHYFSEPTMLQVILLQCVRNNNLFQHQLCLEWFEKKKQIKLRTYDSFAH